MENWQWKFQQLNEKLGNDAWGARIEELETEDGKTNEFMRIFVQNEKIQETVIRETNGMLDKYKIVFTVLKQEDEYKFLEEENIKNVSTK